MDTHQKTLTSRQRLLETLNHRQPDRVCVDFGAGGQTGMGAGAVYRLRKAVLGEDDNYRVKIIEPYQMLGEVDEPLRKALGIDVAGVDAPNTLFGFPNEGWKPFDMHDGTPTLVPEKFNYTIDDDGAVLLYPQGDKSVAPCAKMPTHSYFFDSIIRQEPIDENNLNPEDNCEDFALLSQKEVDYYASKAKSLYDNTEYGVYITLPAVGFGDIAVVPGPYLKRPKGIRDISEWYMSTVLRPDYVQKVFEKQCEVALKNIEMLAEAVGDYAQVAFVSGTDFGAQNSLFVSPKTYRDLYKPFHIAVNKKIHELTNWKTFIHTCGSVFELVPDLIEAGFDILNPVQTSAANMNPRSLKNEFGNDIVFWGGGIDTQSILPFGSPDDVRKEVNEKIEIFNDGGGFVFASIHNVQSNVPLENMLAVFEALKQNGVDVQI
ncbi:uroporphyrinogen decarboxylase family protein [Sedimentisphaera salicampi]|uniref:Methylcobalamin:coenzyme M methyltransferase n=1 Tax=Sedimentisphaera salicampi TaxID=1941349 RepID=A0A1W6LQE3_9BACT|nr:uroporphyrinogen decarboxylase family protein [Sedimentisphaera salicampi]ARN58000.1 methylcobalamin:coenzyme M methyltransferase [Sedimentisphaera salicampi]OXU14165.1 methylcobalamin:coenzyme M methyltransferase [Sedimentisphaera salicampi]